MIRYLHTHLEGKKSIEHVWFGEQIVASIVLLYKYVEVRTFDGL